MNHETTIKRIQSLVPSVMALEFGCEISLYSIGMWGHKASNYYYKVISEKNLEGGNCMDRVLLLIDNGFQESGVGWKPKVGYPETLEITSYWDKRNTESEYELTKGNFHKDFKILGKPITLAVVLLALDLGNRCEENNDTENQTCWCLENTGQICRDWNLSEDNFNDQSEETKTFIGELFNKI